jgi:hypothetical protein
MRDFEEDKNWNWLRAHGRAADFLSMEDRGDGYVNKERICVMYC